MDIKPCIIGPDLTIYPDIIICMVDEPGIPIPGIIGGSWETVLLVGENREIALSMDFAHNLELKGKTGSTDADIKASSIGGELKITGSYAGLYGSYVMFPVEGGYWIKGTNGKSHMDIRITTAGTFNKVQGEVAGAKCELSISMYSENIIMVQGFEGKDKITVYITYTDEGIKVKGTHGPHNLDYMISTLEDRITIKGMTKDGFIDYQMIINSDSEVNVVGKPGRVPVDYKINVFENGASVKGNTGMYFGDYAFVIKGLGEEE